MTQQEVVRGGELVDPFVDAVRLRHVAEGEEIVDRGGADLARQVRHRGERRQLRAEHQGPGAGAGVVERLLAEAVAGEEQALLPAVP